MAANVSCLVRYTVYSFHFPLQIVVVDVKYENGYKTLKKDADLMLLA